MLTLDSSFLLTSLDKAHSLVPFEAFLTETTYFEGCGLPLRNLSSHIRVGSSKKLTIGRHWLL